MKSALKYKQSDGVCDFCAMLNNKELNNVHYFKRLSRWWNGPFIKVADPEYTNKNYALEKNSAETMDVEEPENSDFIDVVVSKVLNFFDMK